MILGYLRVSTEEQASDERTSLQEQERVIRGLAMMRGAGNRDVVLFSDPGISGTIALRNRPAGKELLETARKGDTVCASKLDRLFRSASDALTTAEDLKQRGVDLILIDLGNDPVTGNGTARLFFGILAMVAEFEKERIAERMQAGKKAKESNGGYAGGIVRFGYRKVGKGRQAKLEPIEQEQAILKVIAEHRGERPYQVLKALHAAGLRTRTGSKFQMVQVQRYLKRLPPFDPVQTDQADFPAWPGKKAI